MLSNGSPQRRKVLETEYLTWLHILCGNGFTVPALGSCFREVSDQELDDEVGRLWELVRTTF